MFICSGFRGENYLTNSSILQNCTICLLYSTSLFTLEDKKYRRKSVPAFMTSRMETGILTKRIRQFVVPMVKLQTRCRRNLRQVTVSCLGASKIHTEQGSLELSLTGCTGTWVTIISKHDR